MFLWASKVSQLKALASECPRTACLAAFASYAYRTWQAHRIRRPSSATPEVMSLFFFFGHPDTLKPHKAPWLIFNACQLNSTNAMMAYLQSNASHCTTSVAFVPGLQLPARHPGTLASPILPATVDPSPAGNCRFSIFSTGPKVRASCCCG